MTVTFDIEPKEADRLLDLVAQLDLGDLPYQLAMAIQNEFEGRWVLSEERKLL